MTHRSTTPRRIFGVETEFGITAARTGPGAPTPRPATAPRPAHGASGTPGPTGPETPDSVLFDAEEAARRLFQPVYARARSSNAYLPNGGRIYLDVGSHPEYATAECSDPLELLAQDRAGEEMFAEFAARANETLAEEGLPGVIHLFKNNSDSAGNSFGCHENYLVRRRRDFRAMSDSLVSFFVSRQVLTGAGHVRRRADGTSAWAFSVRSDLVWDAMSSATTRSRPIINTRDEPHADAEQYRRMHIIAGDSNVAQATTLLKVAMTALVLDLVEDGVGLSDLQLAEATRGVRDISHDLTGHATVELASGRTVTAVDLQEEYLARVLANVERRGGTAALSEGYRIGLDLWERGVRALRTGDLDDVASELDWVAKTRLVERYRERARAGLDDPRVARLLLAYHDVTTPGALARRMEAGGLLRELVPPAEVRAAVDSPPQTTRAKLRGDFLAKAHRLRRDVAVDWVAMKIDDGAARTVMLKDPFATSDERVDELMAALDEPPSVGGAYAGGAVL